MVAKSIELLEAAKAQADSLAWLHEVGSVDEVDLSTVSDQDKGKK